MGDRLLRVLCAGDQFITASSLADEVRRSLGDGVETVEFQTQWPTEPFRAVDGVREASGDPAELADLARGVDVVLTHLAPITSAVIGASNSLKVVGVTRGGPVNVDLEAATRARIPVVYLPGRNLSAVAEFTIGAMIALPRSMARASRSMVQGTWDSQYFEFERTGPELSACRIGLVGLGAVGLRVAQLLQPFGAQILGYDPFADPEALRARGITPTALDELLVESDIVSLHARLTDETRRLFDRTRFSQMKLGAYFVNTARGELVDREALLEALQSGHLAGAALDVFDPEPPAADDPLLARPDVLATPHLAGASRQVALGSARRVVDEVATYLQHGTLSHCANPGWTEDRATAPS